MSDTQQATPTEADILQGIGRELQAANRRLDTIKNCVVFLAVVYVISIAVALVVAASSQSN